MFSSLIEVWNDWKTFDTWTVATGAVASMACTLPGTFLVLRRQSMIGDALSHTTLPGIVIAFLGVHWAQGAGWIASDSEFGFVQSMMFFGALIVGVLSTVLTEWIRRIGKVEASAALGVVYATLFALGLLLVRLFTDKIHIDADCVLYGMLETRVFETIPGTDIPEPFVSNLLMLLVNLFLVILFFKELRITAFDPGLANSLGISARGVHYAMMAVTAATLVMAFESVGSILVIAMLITPTATAHLLTDRLWPLILTSLGVAAISALLGHVMAILLPPLLLSGLGIQTTVESSASTAGMMAGAAGMLFVVALLFGPKYGIISRLIRQLAFRLRVASEDILGILFRAEEKTNASPIPLEKISSQSMLVGGVWTRLALARLQRRGQVNQVSEGYELTSEGRKSASQIVRSHRLWESYMSRHFDLPDDHLHEAAERVEHYIDPTTQHELANELDSPNADPHGRNIPKPE